MKTDKRRPNRLVLRGLCAMFAAGLLALFAFAQTALAQNSNGPLNFGENYFVTGDYVVAGVGLRGLGDKSGYATGTITMPDATTVPKGGVPKGAQVVAAMLYWETVESSQTSYAGQQGFFRPVFNGGPAKGYPITGVVLGNPNAPVSWSSGGCSGNSNGSKTIRAYRADVSALLPQDSEGNIEANGTYEVSLADSGSNGGGTPLTLGASLVIVYRVLDPQVSLNSVVIYDGAVAPANGSSTMTQKIEGFYEADAKSPISKLTEIVGNGQSNKYETVSLNGTPLPSLYPAPNGNLPTFPGYYNGSWDNPTWSFPNTNYLDDANPVMPDDQSPITTMVVPSDTNKGCVSWGAIIFSTTVKDTDHDGLLDVWENNKGYCDASIDGGVCNTGDTTDPRWVALPDANPDVKDLFVQYDYMCTTVTNGICDPSGDDFHPPQDALKDVTSAFSAHDIDVHFIPGNAIQEPTCTDTTDTSGTHLCPYPNQPGVVTWKGGFEFLKTQPLNYPDEASCEQAADGPCIHRFQHGRKDSYHYVIFARALGLPQWGFQDGSLVSVTAAGTTVTFTTKDPFTTRDPSGLKSGDRVTIYDAISNPSLNGTYIVQSIGSNSDGYTFTITANSSIDAACCTAVTDPRLSVASDHVGTTSGYSDIGGADSLIALGSWGSEGQATNVIAGTLMHELGHSLGLTHGGTYYTSDATGDYTPTYGANCKPNYQSVMNYLFQVDLFNGLPDYSEQTLSTLDESDLPTSTEGITASSSGATPDYSNTRWYTSSAPDGIGTPATHYCDGRPLPATNAPVMYRVDGTADPITPAAAWGIRSPDVGSKGSDINFDGTLNTGNTSLQGYDDWTHVDLRQIGATGTDIASPGFGTLGAGFGSLGAGFGSLGAGFGTLGAGFGTLGAGFGTLGAGFGTLGAGFGTLGAGFGTLGAGSIGDGHGEINLETANSVTRPPQNLMAGPSTPPRYIVLNWTAPTFGDIGSYNIYRSTNGAAAVKINSVAGGSLTFTDTTVSCGVSYTYFATAVLAGTSPPQESTPSNTTDPVSVPCTFIGFLSPLTTAGTVAQPSFSGTEKQGSAVPIKWEILDANGNPISDLSTLQSLQACESSGPETPPDQSACTLLYSPGYTKGNSTFRFSSPQFIFNWDTTSTIGSVAGYFTIELQLSDGTAVKATTVQFK